MGKLTTYLAALAVAATVYAPAGHADIQQDQEFYRFLTERNQDHPLIVTDFAVVRANGIRSCQLMDEGATPMQALHSIEIPNGPYNFDTANDISSAAGVVYCPWHGSNISSASWAETPTPLNGSFEYPPLAWLPDTMNYAR
jgi:hypothetical protein